MQVAANKVITMDYVLTDPEGTVIDESSEGNFAYLHGFSNIIPGLEVELEGKAVGDELTVVVPPEKGYGERTPEMIQTLNRDQFNPEDPVEVGMQFHASGPDGQMIVVTIADVDGDDVTIDGNHPLAGITLSFNVKIIDVRDASEEEISHGHVHGPEGHDH